MIGWSGSVRQTLMSLSGKKTGGTKSSCKILLVDDSPGALSYLKGILNELMSQYLPETPYTLHEYNSFRRFDVEKEGAYDLAIIDWNLGSTAGENGDKVVEILISEGLCSEIIIFSGMEDDHSSISKFVVRHSGVSFIAKGGADSTSRIKNRLLESVKR